MPIRKKSGNLLKALRISLFVSILLCCLPGRQSLKFSRFSSIFFYFFVCLFFFLFLFFFDYHFFCLFVCCFFFCFFFYYHFFFFYYHFFLLSLGLYWTIIWPILDDLFVSQNARKMCISFTWTDHFPHPAVHSLQLFLC